MRDRRLLTHLFGRDPIGQSHSCCMLLAHIVWSTAGRAAVLDRRLDRLLGEMLDSKANEIGCVLVAVGMAKDHVHAVVRYPSTVALADLVQRLKGATSHACNQRRLVATRLRWQPGYWAESVSPGDLIALTRYVHTQRDRHATPEPAAGGLQTP